LPLPCSSRRDGSVSQRGLIRKPLPEIGVILLHDVERCFVGEIAMVVCIEKRIQVDDVMESPKLAE